VSRHPLLRVRRALVGALAGTAAGVLLLGGCSSGDPAGSASDDPAGSNADTTSSPATGAPKERSAPPSGRPGRLAGLGFRRYAALGDSYTAGIGVSPAADSGLCFRSEVNYPTLVATALGARLRDRSCGGASTADATEPQQLGEQTAPPQVDAVTERTDLVTIGLGGNDFNLFATILGVCTSMRTDDPDGAPCRASTRAGILTQTPQIAARLTTVVAGVRDRAPDATVLLVGYPQLVPARGACPEVLPLAAGDHSYLREVTGLLNDAVREAADRTEAGYVDLARASRGHDVCSSEPWVNGAAGGDGAPYHPRAIGQREAARLVLQALRRG